MFAFAEQPAIYRAMLKDGYSLRIFRNEIKDLAYAILGPQAQNLEHLFEMCASGCYYGLTTLRGGLTLGEEYTDILGVNRSMTLPTLLQRAGLVACLVFGPYLYTHMREHAVTRQPPQASPVLASLTSLWNKVLGLVRSAVPLQIERFHLMLFFLFGAYLQVAHRLIGIRYLFLRKNHQRLVYEHLGVLMLIQFAVGGGLAMRRAYSDWIKTFRRQEGKDELAIVLEEDEDPNANCALCFCARTHPTTTECGHLFCWGCIGECLTNKPECPMCRQPCTVNSLVRLNNYRKAV